MNTTPNSIWRTALAVFIGVTAATIATRAYDDFVLNQQINKAAHALHEQEKQRQQAEEDALRARYLKRAEAEAADERLQKKLAEELANRASQPGTPAAR